MDCLRLLGLIYFIFSIACSGDSSAVGSSGGLISGGAGDSSVVLPSSGCSLSPPVGTTGSVVVNGVTRTYEIRVPGTYNPSTPYKLIFGWHGKSASAFGFASYILSTDMITASADQAIFVFPQGLSLQDIPAGSGGDGSTDSGWDWRTSGRDIQLFDALYAQLSSQFCIDLSHVYTMGRSHGGYFTNVLACARGHLLRASADDSGGMPTTLTSYICSSETMPVWKYHTQDDTQVSYERMGLKVRARWLAENSCTSSTVAVSGRADCVLYNQCGPQGDVIWCNPATGDHATASYAGSDIWDFFNSF